VLDLKAGRALVPGSTQPKETIQMNVKAVLNFWYQGKLVLKGKQIEVDDSVGREIVASGKAVMAAPPAVKEPAPAKESKVSGK